MIHVSDLCIVKEKCITILCIILNYKNLQFKQFVDNVIKKIVDDIAIDL